MMKKTPLALALAAVSLSASAYCGWLYPQATMVESKEPWVTIDGAISEGLFDIEVRLETDAKGDVAVTLPAVTRRYSNGATIEVLPE